jgi:hypothetical protein
VTLETARDLAQFYGVAVGDGDGDSSAPAAFFLAVLFFGDGDGDSSVVVFFFVEVVLAAVDFFAAVPFLLVEAAVVLVEAVSFLFAHETKNATATRTMIELRTDFFIR